MSLQHSNQTPETHHPLCEGDFFTPQEPHLLPLPDYDVGLDDSYRKIIQPGHKTRFGTTWVEERRMSDGTRRQVLQGMSSRALTDIVVCKNTAWGTQVRGFNEDVADVIMSQGFHVEVIGPEINASLPLSRSAYDTHVILNQAQERGYYDNELIAQEGYSRGGMLGFGVIAYAHRFNRHVIYSNLTDPCLEHRPSFSREEATEVAASIPKELLTVAVQIGGLALRPNKARRYLRSIDLSTNGARQFVRTGVPLFSGESGFLARHAAKTNPKMLLCFFRDSFANHEREFVKIFDDCLDVDIKNPDGGHIQGMDRRILGHIATRFSRLGQQLQEGRLPQEIDYALIHNRAKAS